MKSFADKFSDKLGKAPREQLIKDLNEVMSMDMEGPTVAEVLLAANAPKVPQVSPLVKSYIPTPPNTP